MKKQKLAVVFAALLTLVGFSSCLNSEDDGIRQYYGYMEVNPGFTSVTFSTPDGVEFVPSKSVTSSSNSKLAFIYCQYNANDLTTDSKKLSVTLLSDPVYLKSLDYTGGSVLPAETSTVSLSSLGESDGGIWGFNKYLILMPSYKVKKGTTQENLSSELTNHQLSVYYVPENDDTNTNTLKLYLRYQIAGVGTSSTEENVDDTESWASDYTIQYSDAVYVTLSNFIARYQSAHGAEPEKITVEYEVNNGTSFPSIAKKQTKTVTYTLYKNTTNN